MYLYSVILRPRAIVAAVCCIVALPTTALTIAVPQHGLGLAAMGAVFALLLCALYGRRQSQTLQAVRAHLGPSPVRSSDGVWLSRDGNKRMRCEWHHRAGLLDSIVGFTQGQGPTCLLLETRGHDDELELTVIVGVLLRSRPRRNEHSSSPTTESPRPQQPTVKVIWYPRDFRSVRDDVEVTGVRWSGELARWQVTFEVDWPWAIDLAEWSSESTLD